MKLLLRKYFKYYPNIIKVKNKPWFYSCFDDISILSVADLRKILSVRVNEPNWFKRHNYTFTFHLKVSGLCGNFNGNINDDTLTPSGDDNKDVSKFAADI